MALNGDFDLKLADVIYTVLYKFHPKVLDAFLDVNSHLEFHFEREENPNSDDLNFRPGLLKKALMLWRK